MIKAPAMAAFGLGGFFLATIVGCAAAERAIQPPPETSPERDVLGVGGVFFKVDDPEALREWYRRHLGLEQGGARGINFLWREHHDPDLVGFTVWSPFPRDTDYFGASGQEFMINYRVRDLDALLARLRGNGIRQVGGIEAYSYGRFAWVIDGDGNRVELWEPTPIQP